MPPNRQSADQAFCEVNGLRSRRTTQTLGTPNTKEISVSARRGPALPNRDTRHGAAQRRRLCVPTGLSEPSPVAASCSVAIIVGYSTDTAESRPRPWSRVTPMSWPDRCVWAAAPTSTSSSRRRVAALPEATAASKLGTSGRAAQRVSAVLDLVCRQWRCGGLVDDAVVVVSELRARHGGGVLRIELVDRSPEAPTPRSGISDLGGPGLLAVAALSYSWGVDPHADGKLVRAEFSRTRQEAS